MTKILLVEDDKSLREIYGVRLLAEGYDIVSAGDGEEALAMAIKEKPTLIVSDVMMPKISGFDMLDILRSTTETRDIKVIMMTALSSDDQRSRGEQLGADRYLVKSQVGIEDVVRTVHEVLADVPSAAASAPATAVPAAAPAEPADDATAAPASTPIDPLVADSIVTPVTEPVIAPAAPVDDTSATIASDGPLETANAAPGNDAAGPLPPQPAETELETTLPQPTAPFTSPRPTNLGERVIQPLNNNIEPGSTSDVSERITKELQASAEPVTSTQVDEAISDTDVEPLVESPEPAAIDTPSSQEPAFPTTDSLQPAAPVDPSVAPAGEKPPVPGTNPSAV